MNELIYRNDNQPIEVVCDSEAIRRFLMADVLQTITDALGEVSDEKPFDRSKRRQEAIKYILSKDFELDMEAIGYLHRVKKVRNDVLKSTDRMPIDCKREVCNGIRI